METRGFPQSRTGCGSLVAGFQGSNELGLRSGVNSSSVDQLVADLGLSGKSPRDEMETPNQRQP